MKGHSVASSVILAIVSAACSSESTADNHSYNIEMIIEGTRQAFGTRSFEMEGKVAPSGPYFENEQISIYRARVWLCTNSHQLFLEAPINMKVLEQGNIIWQDDVVRYGCRYMEDGESGHREVNTLKLNDDGSVATEFGTDPDVSSICWVDYEGAPPCEHDDLATE